MASIGCIGPEFDLDGKQLIVLGPMRTQRPSGAGSGLYSDAAGMRVASGPEATERISQYGPAWDVVRIAAGSSYRIPSAAVVVVNPFSDRPYMVAGHWSVQFETLTNTTNLGRVRASMQPAPYENPAPDGAFAFRHGALPGTQRWGNSGVWPVCEVLAAGERISLYANAHVVNETPVEVQLTYRNVLFSGIEAPAASGLPVPTLGAVAARESGKTLGAITAAHTGQTLAQLVEEWSK